MCAYHCTPVLCLCNVFTFMCVSTLYYCPVRAGVAVATAFCAIESPAVTNANEWTFGVTDTGISDFSIF